MRIIWQMKMIASLFWSAAIGWAIGACGAGPAYDPLCTAPGFTAEVLDIEVHDRVRRRGIPIRVYLPSEESPRPVTLFSHGLGGSRETGSYLGRHWSARGYVAVFLQHPGSDESIWKGRSVEGKKAGMQGATTGENLILRVKDVCAVLDQLDQWNKTVGHALAGRVNLDRVACPGTRLEP
jgi:predicted dienelactone hydrolase